MRRADVGGALFAVGLLAASLVAAPLFPAPLGGQEVSLDNVETLVRQGRTEEARSILTRWIDAVDGNAPRLDLQRSVWLRGLLTVDPEQAAVDFQRLVVEFPGGGWTDQALLRLGQLEVTRGDPAAAAAHFRILVRDHPGSPARLVAREWLEGNAEQVARAEAEAARERERRRAEAASAPPASAPAEIVEAPAVEPEPPVEETAAAPPLPPDTLGRERLARRGAPEVESAAAASGDPSASAESAERPPGAEVRPEPVSPSGTPRSDTAPSGNAPSGTAPSGTAPSGTAPSGTAPSGAGADEADGTFTVQLGAFASVTRARSFMGSVAEAGFEPRLVDIPGSDLVRVRVGRFRSPETATRLYDQVVAKGFEAAVVADAQREVPHGG